MPCLIHRGQPLPCSLCALEDRLPDLDDNQLDSIAVYIEQIPDRRALTGQLQGDALHIAALVRELARKLAA
jgi:hypothetical protein